MHFHTMDAVQTSFATLKEFLCPNGNQQMTTLCTHGSNEHNFLAKCNLQATNLQHQEENALKSLCSECTCITGRSCQKNTDAVKHWIHNGFFHLLNPVANWLESLQNSTVARMCVANAVAILTLTENSSTTGKRSQTPEAATAFDSQPVGSVDSSDSV